MQKGLLVGLKIPVTALFRGADTDRDATFTTSGQGSLTVRSGTQHGHEYRVLGTLKGRTVALEPTLVTLTDASDVFPLFQHPGTEFIYMLAGKWFTDTAPMSTPWRRGTLSCWTAKARTVRWSCWTCLFGSWPSPPGNPPRPVRLMDAPETRPPGD